MKEDRLEIPDGVSFETGKLVNSAFKLLEEKPRHGLNHPVSEYEPTHDGTRWFGQRIHYWVTFAGKTIGLRVFEHTSRPKRRVLRDLLAKNSPPTLMIYARMTLEAVTHKLAECIKIGLNRMRKGLIECIKEKVDDGLVPRCDNGNFTGRIPNQFQLSAMQAGSG